MRMIGIYKIQSPSGKVYIGQSWSIRDRWNVHRSVSKNGIGNTILKKSFAKYGINNHAFSVEHTLPEDVDQSTFDLYEQLYMDFYRNAGVTLMNIKEAGGNGKQGRMPEYHKSKISLANKGKKKSEDHNRRNSESKKGDKCYLYGIDPSLHPNAIKVRCNKTGIIYGSVTQAAKAIGFKRSTLSMILTGKNVNNTTLSYDNK